jgi:hypothetical protein
MSDSAEFSAGARGPVGPDAATTGVFPTKARLHRAFIRYSRADPPWANWLLKKLEGDGQRELQRRNRRLPLITAASVVAWCQPTPGFTAERSNRRASSPSGSPPPFFGTRLKLKSPNGVLSVRVRPERNPKNRRTAWLRRNVPIPDRSFPSASTRPLAR